MDYLTTEAIVLRRRPFSETSLIVTLFTERLGRVDALAKGSRRRSSPMAGHLDLYMREHVTIFRRVRSGLDLLTESDLVDEMFSLRSSFDHSLAASALCETAWRMFLPHDPHPVVYQTLANGLHHLSQHADRYTVLSWCLLRFLREAGVAPHVGGCIQCGAAVGEGNLSYRAGGWVCSRCPQQATEGGYHLMSPERKALEYLSRVELPAACRLGGSTSLRRVVGEAICEYVQQSLGRRVRSYAHLQRTGRLPPARAS